jgi:hypothetical protein
MRWIQFYYCVVREMKVILAHSIMYKTFPGIQNTFDISTRAMRCQISIFNCVFRLPKAPTLRMTASEALRSSTLSCTGSTITALGSRPHEVTSADSAACCRALELVLSTGYRDARSLVGLNTSRTTSKSKEIE